MSEIGYILETGNKFGKRQKREHYTAFLARISALPRAERRREYKAYAAHEFRKAIEGLHNRYAGFEASSRKRLVQLALHYWNQMAESTRKGFEQSGIAVIQDGVSLIPAREAINRLEDELYFRK